MSGRVDKKRTRNAVAAYFAVYRRFVQLLDAGTVPREELQPVPGYEDAADPDLIHAPGFSFSGGGVREVDGKLRYMAWFVRDVNRVVRGLPKYHEAILRLQYMGREQLTNEDTYRELIDRKFYCSERNFERERHDAVFAFADILGISLYMEHSQ